jgi:hypothetical protein
VKRQQSELPGKKGQACGLRDDGRIAKIPCGRDVEFQGVVVRGYERELKREPGLARLTASGQGKHGGSKLAWPLDVNVDIVYLGGDRQIAPHSHCDFRGVLAALF